MPHDQVFYVIEGARLSKYTSRRTFSAPAYHCPTREMYYIENIVERDARIFFAQAHRVAADGGQLPDNQPAPGFTSAGHQRSSAWTTRAASPIGGPAL
jgi:hypothetical protein